VFYVKLQTDDFFSLTFTFKLNPKKKNSMVIEVENEIGLDFERTEVGPWGPPNAEQPGK